MKVDILFIDIACAKGYNWTSLEDDSIGGTEASTIRLAEGFASKGLKVVICSKYGFHGLESPGGVIYAPLTWLDQLQPKNVIHLRYRGLLDKFPNAKQFVWLHDAAGLEHNNVSDWPEQMKKYTAQAIAVSDWHVKNVLSIAPGMPIQRIYSPVDETCFTFPRPTVDKNQMVWMSSPHKGLEEALGLFQDIRSNIPEMKLVVFNPGYCKTAPTSFPGVAFVPEASRAMVRSVVASSLCLFYPTMFEETFGLVAAEANALGTPVACFPTAALAESCGNDFCADLNDLGSRVLKWRETRPYVVGQERFRFEAVYFDWIKLLD